MTSPQNERCQHSETDMKFRELRLPFHQHQSYRFESSYIGNTETDPSLLLKNVNYYVTKRSGQWWKGCCLRPIQQKHVLKGISVKFESGQFIAILGSSGSGKTSLLDVIACRAEGKARGKITYKCLPINVDVMKEYAAYVIQSDTLLTNLTVRETLTYAALLRLPSHTTSAEIRDKVKSVIQEVGLKNVADSRIGGTIVRGISGGEKRRVAIAIQLLQNPDILLLDEPTTGLDSCNTRSLVNRLKDISKKGTMVVMTIHQPGSQLFRLFDKITLLSEGNLVFHGDQEEILEFFTNLGYQCPTFANPLDYFIDLVSIDRRTKTSERDCEKRLKIVVEEYKKWSKRNMSNGFHKVPSTNSFIETSSTHKQRNLPGVARTVSTLTRRMMTYSLRDRTIYVSRLFLTTCYVPFIIAFLGRMGTDQTSVQDRIGLMYQTLIVPPYAASLNVAAIFPPLRDLYLRDSTDGLYSTTVFTAAYLLHVMPFQLISSTVFSSLVYWITGLKPEVQCFLIYFAVVLILQLIGEIIAVGAMGFFRNGQIATNIVTLIMTASLLFASGLLRSIDSMLDLLKAVRWVTVHKYAAEILMTNEFYHLNLKCHNTNDSFCQFPSGDSYLDIFYPGSADDIPWNFLVLCAHVFSFIVCTIFALKIKVILHKH